MEMSEMWRRGVELREGDMSADMMRWKEDQ